MSIYLDYAATTPVDPRVANLMHRFLTADGIFGNPSSNHSIGKVAKNAIEEARQKVALLFNREPSEIIWTSGATESNNLAIKGIASLYEHQGKHIITLKTEHRSVLDPCEYLEKKGFTVTYLPLESNGLLNLNRLSEALRKDTILCSIMHVNNETGVIQPIEEIAHIVKHHGVLLHVDAAQSTGKLPLDLNAIPIDLLSSSAHKMYGPKGMGILYMRRKPRVKVAPLLHGGGQEQGMRAGTLPTHQIVGMGEACRIASDEMEKDIKHISSLRDLFIEGTNSIKNRVFNTELNHAYPGILNVRFEGIDGMRIVNACPDLAFSLGSACHSKGVEGSYVLRAMGQSETRAKSGVRISLGRFTTQDDIKKAIEFLSCAVEKIRDTK